MLGPCPGALGLCWALLLAGEGRGCSSPAGGGHSPAPVSLTAPPGCASALPQLYRPAALTRRVDGVQRHLPGSYEPAHLLQVPLLDVVLEDDVVGEAHGAGGAQAGPVPAVPRHRQGALVPHAGRSLQAQRHGGAQHPAQSPTALLAPLLPVRGSPRRRSVLAPHCRAPAVPRLGPCPLAAGQWWPPCSSALPESHTGGGTWLTYRPSAQD